MIEYQFKEEKDFAIGYAKELDSPIVLSILSRGYLETEEEARALSVFFWDMVDKTIEAEQQGTTEEWNKDGRLWTEKLLQTFGAYLRTIGYSDNWDEEVDKQ